MNLSKLKELAEKAKTEANKDVAADHPVTNWEAYLEEVYEPDTVLKLIEAVEVMREALKQIESSGDKTLLGRCCVDGSCVKDPEHGCTAQITAHNAFRQSAWEATDALSEVEKILGEKGEG